MFFYVLLYIFLLFLSLEFPCNIFLYHLGSDPQALEVGRFFPIGFIILVYYPLCCWWLLCSFSNMHSDMVWFIVHSQVIWLWAEQTVSSLHNWCLLCSIKDFCSQLSPLLMALLLKGAMNIHCFDAFKHVFSCPVCSRTAQFPNLSYFPISTSIYMIAFLHAQRC